MLEIGGGLGVLSEHLAERVAHVHVVEVDERLREPLLDATAPHPNVTVHWGDAMTLDLAALEPGPGQGRREPPLRDRGRRAAAHDRAASRGRALGGDGAARGRRAPGRIGRRRAPTARRRCSPSSPARSASCARSRAPSSIRCRTSTRCWSGCAAVQATAARRPRRCARWSQARSRTGARRSPARSRSPARGACRLARAGAGRARAARPSAGRARRAPGAAGLPRAGRNPWAVTAAPPTLRALAPAKINLGLFLGPVRESDGAPRAGHGDAVDLARRRADARPGAARGGSATSSSAPGCRGAPEENLAARALRGVPRSDRLGGAAAAPDRSTSGSPWPPAWPAARPTRRRRCGWPVRPPGSATRSCCCRSPPGWAPTCPPRSRPGAGSPRAPASASSACRRPARGLGIIVLAATFELSTAAVYAEADRLGLARERSRARPAL